ncbi:MAG: endonuclease III domain-containing protein [Planctomycetes bacterium]|nr:endonuclease III domain-containing protein [Planctomycetota bacterium]
MRDLRAFYRALLRRYGPQKWWPAEGPFEVMVGAILTQNTAWTNVEKAIATLKSNGLLDPRRLDEMDAGTLALAIRPAGYFNVKAMRLKSFVRWFLDRFAGDVERMKRTAPGPLREELLAVKGVGPETADSILLYALGAPTFVVDQYTYRLATRHGLVAEDAGYDDLKEVFETRLRGDARLYNEFHALIVAVGKECCRPVARCESCPLRRFLARRGF